MTARKNGKNLNSRINSHDETLKYLAKTPTKNSKNHNKTLKNTKKIPQKPAKSPKK
jgi:hypothetical protein